MTITTLGIIITIIFFKFIYDLSKPFIISDKEAINKLKNEKRKIQ